MGYTHTYETYTDLSTAANRMTIITVYAGGNTAVFRSLPYFCAFKYYKLGPVTIKLVPASTLPVDPTGLSYAQGASTVDPRDMLTPGLVRITNGEDFFLGTNYDETNVFGVYNAMLLDDRWFKWSLQSGITKSAKPLYWTIGQIKQDYYPGAVTNVPVTHHTDDAAGRDPANYITTGAIEQFIRTAKTEQEGKLWEVKGANNWTKTGYSGMSSGRGIFQTGTHGEMGWLPTDAQAFIGFNPDDEGHAPLIKPTVNNVPQVELFRVILPPSRKTLFFYRMFVTETIYFREPVVQNPETYIKVGKNRVTKFYRPLDRFIFTKGVSAAFPTLSVPPDSPDVPIVKNEGGNDINNMQKHVMPPEPEPEEDQNGSDS